MTACASEGDRTVSSATAAVPEGADMSGGVERSVTASNVNATPPGRAIHPPLRQAETIRSTNCWTREGRWGGAMAVAAHCRSTTISPALGSHRAMMLRLTTRSRAPAQERLLWALGDTQRPHVAGGCEGPAGEPVTFIGAPGPPWAGSKEEDYPTYERRPTSYDRKGQLFRMIQRGKQPNMRCGERKDYCKHPK
jgi:hypothetical protein